MVDRNRCEKCLNGEMHSLCRAEPNHLTAEDMQEEQPYCEAQAGGMECGRPVKQWAHQCEKHDPEGAARRSVDRGQTALRDAFMAGALAQEDVEHCARLGVYHRMESYFQDFLDSDMPNENELEEALLWTARRTNQVAFLLFQQAVQREPDWEGPVTWDHWDQLQIEEERADWRKLAVDILTLIEGT